MSTCSLYVDAVTAAAPENHVPIRPRPIKPHVARFLVVEAKVLRAIEPSGLGEVALLSMHSREGEKRTDTAALMTGVTGRDKRSNGEAVRSRPRPEDRTAESSQWLVWW